MASRLAHCPFCPDGGAPEINYGRGGEKVYVKCFGCGLFSPLFKTKKEAEQYWNTRAERTCTIEEGSGYDDLLEEEFWHLSCGHLVRGSKPDFCSKCGAKVVE